MLFLKSVGVSCLSSPPGLCPNVKYGDDTAGVELAEVLGTEAPLTSLQSRGHLESSGGRCNLFVNVGLKAEFSLPANLTNEQLVVDPPQHTMGVVNCAETASVRCDLQQR